MSDPSNRFAATVESVDRRAGQAWFRVAGGRIAGEALGLRPGDRATIVVRPEDVLLGGEHPGRVSARNVLPGHVRRLRASPRGRVVELDVGFPLRALVTEAAVRDLALRRGARAFAILKATAVEVASEVRPAPRVSLAGRSGELSADRLAFLALLGRAGSLAAAARAAGVSYRSAWKRMREAEARWGGPLVRKRRGAGGGVALTPEARALLGIARRAQVAAESAVRAALGVRRGSRGHSRPETTEKESSST